MSCWDILGTPPLSDQRALKRAYAKELKKHRPDKDPEGFQRLREALYEAKERIAHPEWFEDHEEEIIEGAELEELEPSVELEHPILDTDITTEEAQEEPKIPSPSLIPLKNEAGKGSDTEITLLHQSLHQIRKNPSLIPAWSISLEEIYSEKDPTALLQTISVQDLMAELKEDLNHVTFLMLRAGLIQSQWGTTFELCQKIIDKKDEFRNMATAYTARYLGLCCSMVEPGMANFFADFFYENVHAYEQSFMMDDLDSFLSLPQETQHLSRVEKLSLTTFILAGDDQRIAKDISTLRAILKRIDQPIIVTSLIERHSPELFTKVARTMKKTKPNAEVGSLSSSGCSTPTFGLGIAIFFALKLILGGISGFSGSSNSYERLDVQEILEQSRLRREKERLLIDQTSQRFPEGIPFIEREKDPVPLGEPLRSYHIDIPLPPKEQQSNPDFSLGTENLVPSSNEEEDSFGEGPKVFTQDELIRFLEERGIHREALFSKPESTENSP